MASKKTRKLIQETMVEKPTQDLNVPSKTIREEEQEDSKEQEDRDNYDDHENEKEQPTTILFIPKQLEVLLKMNRPDFIGLVEALKGVGFKPIKFGNFDDV
jgi:hypothetical protein